MCLSVTLFLINCFFMLTFCLTAQKLSWNSWWISADTEVTLVHLQQLIFDTCIMSRGEILLVEALHKLTMAVYRSCTTWQRKGSCSCRVWLFRLKHPAVLKQQQVMFSFQWKLLAAMWDLLLYWRDRTWCGKVQFTAIYALVERYV